MRKKWHRAVSAMLCVAMVMAFAACGEKKPSNDDQTHTDGGSNDTMINAVTYGLDNTGKTDLTHEMIEMHKEGAKTGKKIYYPNGTYLFNGTTLDFTSGVEFESQDGVLIRNSISDTQIINFDDAGNLIGLMHNHLEYKLTGGGFVRSGNLVSPPISTASYETTVDFLPYWYNDFGLQRTAAGLGGSKVWYDWRWNHHDAGNTPGNDPYDPTLHPLLGFYRGDDPVVLDWTCYWLQEYGMKQSIIYNNGPIDAAVWEDPTSKEHWIYELFNNTPNAKNMKFACFVWANDYTTTETAIRDAWWKTFNTFYFDEQYADMIYCVEKDGKKYPVIVLWDEDSIRNSLGQNMDAMLALYKDAAQAFRDKGFDGVCIMARNDRFSRDENAPIREDLLANGVLWYACNYPKNAVPNKGTYAKSIDSFVRMDDPSRIYGVATGMHTHTPHPSKWVCPGSNPTDFARWIKTVLDAIDAVPEKPRMITCYNISEWSEGGPGLIPTVADRFGYLEAIRDSIVIKS